MQTDIRRVKKKTRNQHTLRVRPLTIIVTTAIGVAAIRDVSVIIVLPAIGAPVVGGGGEGRLCPAATTIGAPSESLGFQSGGIIDGMVTVDDNFSSFWKLAIIVELLLDRNISFFVQMLKWYQSRLRGQLHTFIV